MVESKIEGLLLTPLKQIFNARGSVLHMMRSDSLGFNGFGEVYFSQINPGAIKAWKLHQRQTQNFSVPVGSIRLIVFDDREKSDSRGVVQEFEVGITSNYLRVTVPPGLWYGLICVGSQTALLVNCADIPHDPLESCQREMDDSSMPKIHSGNWKL